MKRKVNSVMKKRVVSLIMALNVIMTGVNITTPTGAWAEEEVQDVVISEISGEAQEVILEEIIPEESVSEEIILDREAEEVSDEADGEIKVINGEKFAPNGELLSRVDKTEGIELFALPSMSAQDRESAASSIANATYKGTPVAWISKSGSIIHIPFLRQIHMLSKQSASMIQ